MQPKGVVDGEMSNTWWISEYGWGALNGVMGRRGQLHLKKKMVSCLSATRGCPKGRQEVWARSKLRGRDLGNIETVQGRGCSERKQKKYKWQAVHLRDWDRTIAKGKGGKGVRILRGGEGKRGEGIRGRVKARASKEGEGTRYIRCGLYRKGVERILGQTTSNQGFASRKTGVIRKGTGPSENILE